MKQHQTLRRGLGVLLALVMCLSLLPTTVLAEEMEIHIPIDEKTFPDQTFREEYVRIFDTDSSGALSAAERAAVTEIKCSGKGIKTLNGIGNFKQLTYLDCSNNQLAALNVSNNNNLTHLDCSGNQLTSLNVDYNTALEFLNCSGNQLTSLDLRYTKVTDLNADNNIYAITLTGGTFDLSKLPGNFGVSKASNWKNGTANGNILTVNSGATEVTYDYNCGRERSVTFALKVVEGYTITFSANGGSGSMDAETVVSGSYTLPTCTFTAPAGKQFKGWATSATGEVIADATITVTGNTTLYAIWEDKACNKTADFTSGDGSDALALLNAAKTEGAADSEWDSTNKKLTLKGVDFTTTSPTAVKLPGGSTIVLVGDNIITTSEQPRTLSYGIDVTGDLTIEGSGTLTAMGAENADLSIGINANGVVKIKSGTVIAAGRKATRSSIGIYAYKVAISGGTVTATGGEAGYSSCGIYAYGSNIAISGGHVTAQTLSTTGEKSALNKAPDLSAYTGYKWRTSSVGAFTSSSDKAYSHNNDYTYVEFSDGRTYTVTFNANGGSSSMDAVTGVSGDYTLPANGFTAPSGKQFKGWATSKDGAVITGTTITVTGDTTLYAIWENTYTVTVESGGNGTASATHATAAAGTEITLTASPNTGYHFKEWQVDGNNVELDNANNATTTFTMPASNVTVKAIFEMDKYTVTFDANGGSVTPESAETDANGKLATLPTPTRDGYRFDGWYTAANGGNKITKDTAFTADTTVYAHWTKKTISGSSGSGANSGTAIVQSAKTADIGVMIYGMTALLSLTGGAWMIGKKKEH